MHSALAPPIHLPPLQHARRKRGDALYVSTREGGTELSLTHCFSKGNRTARGESAAARATGYPSSSAHHQPLADARGLPLVDGEPGHVVLIGCRVAPALPVPLPYMEAVKTWRPRSNAAAEQKPRQLKPGASLH